MGHAQHDDPNDDEQEWAGTGMLILSLILAAGMLVVLLQSFNAVDDHSVSDSQDALESASVGVP